MTVSAPVPLSADHNCEGFDSGVPSLDDWLRRWAGRDQASGATRTFVCCDESRVIAYYALAFSAVSTSSAPGRFKRNMPDPIPVVVLARLVISRSYQARGLGRALFQDAARRVIFAADSIGIRGLLVHTISADARAFYLRLGFDPSPFDDMTLMTTMADLKAALVP
ncbi:MAG: GNAT family N-acetyltransferase [Betaproteobacteria bacterium]|nr:GNAT family N-acetyltransferase [Betaproteobacteria bacterium]